MRGSDGVRSNGSGARAAAHLVCQEHHRDRHERVLYVGKARDLRARLRSYELVAQAFELT